MSAIFTSIVPTTELEAVNAMLSAVGIAPLSTLDPLPTATDVTMAISMLRDTCREVCDMGWRFNMEWGYQLSPASSVSWTGTDGKTLTLNLFQAPTGLARFRTTACDGQIGSRAIDTVLLNVASTQVVATDTLVDTAGTLLSAHAGPAGAAWTVISGTESSANETMGASGILFNGTEVDYKLGLTLTSPNYSVQMDAANTGTDSGQFQLLLRVPDEAMTTPHGYILGWGAGNMFIGVQKDDVTFTQLASATPAANVSGSKHTIKFSVTGSVLEGYIDGVLAISAVDTANTFPLAGLPGFSGFGPTLFEMTLSNFVVTYGSTGGLSFYDRAANRFGFDSTKYPFLYIDPIWFVDFLNMPESARRYITMRSARQFAQRVVGSAELSSFSSQDETFALRTLKRYEGQEDDGCNMFDHMLDAAAFLGNRTRYMSGIVDPRNSPSSITPT